MKIPFGTITITQRSKDLVMQCLEEGRVSSGRLVRQFEEKAAELIGVAETVAVSSGTDADTLGLALAYERGAKRGDEVIIPALSFVATGNAVLHAGFKPVFVDVDPLTMNIDPKSIEAAVTPRTCAIMPVHLMGKPAEMDTVMDIAQRHNLLVVEDAAEAWGAQYKGRNIGSIGHAGAFSLYVAHILSTGEGGLITTNSEEFAEAARSLRAHGRACKCKVCVSNTTSGFCAKRFDGTLGDIRFRFERVGYSCKMTELSAALGLGNLDEYDAILGTRHRNLLEAIEKFRQFEEFFQIFPEAAHEKIGPHAFPFIVRAGAPFNRDELLLALEKAGIDARTLFCSIPTECGGYEFLGHRYGDFPVAENVGKNGLHIGIHQDVTSAHIDYFIDVVGEFLRGKKAR
jgi:dTDP-4-amino-4,6-dideoxygalactose transaminase